MKIRPNRTLVILLLTCVPILLSGCAKEEAADELTGTAGSCTVVNGIFTMCFDYVGAGYTAASAQTSCDSTTSGEAVGTYSSSSCPTAARVGSCRIYAGEVTEQVLRYFGGYDDTLAALSCSEASGVYTSG